MSYTERPPSLRDRPEPNTGQTRLFKKRIAVICGLWFMDTSEP